MEFYNAHVRARDQFLYEKELEDIIKAAETKYLVLKLCRAMHGENFGKPGYGTVSFVLTELEKAEKAVKTVLECIE